MQANEVRVIGVGFGQSQSQVVAFRTGIDEKTDGQTVGKCGSYFLSAEHDLVVEEPVVGVEELHLFVDSLDYPLLAVAH